MIRPPWCGSVPGQRVLLSILVCIVFLPVLLIPGIGSISCSGQRYRHRVGEIHQLESRRSTADSIHLSWRSGGATVQLFHGEQQVLIVPEGPFRFHTDSGFRGSAAYILLGSQTDRASYGSDSAAGTVVQRSHRDSLERISHDTVRDLRESRYQTGLRIPVWIWLIILTGVWWIVRQIWRAVRE